MEGLRLPSSLNAPGTPRGAQSPHAVKGSPPEWTVEPVMGIRDVARIVGISPERVCQLERKALRKLVDGIRRDRALRDAWEHPDPPADPWASD